MEQPAGRASPAMSESGDEEQQIKHGRGFDIWLASEKGSLDPVHEVALVIRAYLVLTDPRALR